MGNASSSLNDQSTADISNFCRGLGSKYEQYATLIEDNGVDGQFLANLGGVEELEETFEELEIVSKIHKRVLANKWKDAKDKEANHQEKASLNSQNKNLPSVITTKRDSSWSGGTITRASRRETAVRIDAANMLGWDKETPDEELETLFGNAVNTAFEKRRKSLYYAGVHLLHEDGHTALASRSSVVGSNKQRMHAPVHQSICYDILVNDPNPESDDLVVRRLEPGVVPWADDGKGAIYCGRKLRNDEGEIIGTVCTIQAEEEEKEETDAEEDPEESFEEIMGELAATAQNQLKEQSKLKRRNSDLRLQISAQKGQVRRASLQESQRLQNIPDEVLLPAEEGLDAVTAEHLRGRPEDFPYPEEVAKQGYRQSSKLQAFWNSDVAATEPQEMEHLPPDYFDVLDSEKLDRTPIGKEDLQRSAVAEELKLWELDPESSAAAAIKILVDKAARLFKLPFVHINTITSNTLYSIARHYDLQGEKKEMMDPLFNTLSTDSQGCPYVCEFSGGRATAICNYPAVSKRTYVVHEMAKEKSFSFFPFGFYAGSPVIYKGYVVATLCMIDVDPRPDFKKEHEVRAEQIARLVSTEIENWALRREMDKLEKERDLAMNKLGKAKSAFPIDQAALIFTDVQGSTTLWESDPNAMQKALEIHDDIMRQCCAKNYGAEIKTEGDAFHIAFHDAVDAIAFALNVQEELYDAPWSSNILALKDACDDGKGFRGLRVRIAVHFGDVKCRDNSVTRKKEYYGKTYNITKRLEHMSHGGQTLVCSEDWNQASFLADSKLNSPHILDLGSHVIYTGNRKHEGVVTKEIFQVLPSRLRTRKFPPILTTQQLTPAFHEAPCPDDKQITVVFIYTGKVEEAHNDSTLVLAFLAKQIGTILGRGPGYQCKNFMLAFKSIPEAVDFGLRLHDWFHDTAQQDLLQVGIHRGEFTTMREDKTTGRADYYGKAVNRCARVASATPPGKVCVGVVKDDHFSLSDYDCEPLGSFVLKGVQEEMTLYSVHRF